MPVRSVEIAVPAAAGPCFELHRHGADVGHFIHRAELFEQRLERFRDGRLYVNLLRHAERQVFYGRFSDCHVLPSFQKCPKELTNPIFSPPVPSLCSTDVATSVQTYLSIPTAG